MAYDEDLAARVRVVLPAGAAVTERQMFGGLAFMLGGHMFCGVVKDTLMWRLARPPAAGAPTVTPKRRPAARSGKMPPPPGRILDCLVQFAASMCACRASR